VTVLVWLRCPCVRLRLACCVRTRDDAMKAGGDVTNRLQALQMELDIKASAIVNLTSELTTMQALAADLESQLRNAGNAATVRQLERQLRQTVLVHRQLIRKVWCRSRPFDD
jgi:hypothetical protein